MAADLLTLAGRINRVLKEIPSKEKRIEVIDFVRSSLDFAPGEKDVKSNPARPKQSLPTPHPELDDDAEHVQ